MTFTDVLNNIWNWIITEGIKVVIGIIIFLILCKVINWVCRKIEKSLLKKQVDVTITKSAISFTRKALKVLLFISFLTLIGIETSSISAAIASIGLAIGLSLQGSLSNFAGGVIILCVRPFRIGDTITCNGETGTVERIELFYTYIVTGDNRVVMMPNADVANSKITNASAKETRRLDMTFSIAYDNDHNAARDIILREIESTNLALNEPDAPFVNIVAHNASSVDLEMRVWVKTENYQKLKWILLEKIKEAFDENGISIPFQQVDVHITEPVGTPKYKDKRALVVKQESELPVVKPMQSNIPVVVEPTDNTSQVKKRRGRKRKEKKNV